MTPATWLQATVPLLLLAACSAGGGPTRRAPSSQGPPAELPLAVAPPTTEEPPRDLPDVDTSTLNERERRGYWALVTALLAPCPEEAVTVAVCVEERRPCRACVLAARLLAREVRDGATRTGAERAFSARFGPQAAHEVPLHDSPARGAEQASVTIVVWHDFQCPFCARAMPHLDEAVRRFPRDVRLVHKFYPLPSHTHAEPAARAALAAHRQGRYWAMEELLFENQHALDAASLERYAVQAGLDLGRFRVDLAGEAARRHLDRDRADADAARLDGTPYILINGRTFHLGLFSLESDLVPWIEDELELARERRARAAR